LSGGYPKILENLQQPIAPDLRHGWEHRLKSEHFSEYKKVAEEFSKLVDIDSWLINPYFRNCGEVDFMAGEGLDCLQYNAEVLFRAIQKKYDQYNIKEQPFIIIKADAGSYGMGIMSIKSADELLKPNRKQRTHMAKMKGKVSVSKVILQEGVHTFETWDDEVAEPVVYMVGDYVVGGFYRLNTKRGSTENLNSPGMHFQSLAFADTCQAPGKKACAASQRRFYIYGVIARLAAAKEL
jgi:glutamate--cysteine ligase